MSFIFPSFRATSHGLVMLTATELERISSRLLALVSCSCSTAVWMSSFCGNIPISKSFFKIISSVMFFFKMLESLILEVVLESPAGMLEIRYRRCRCFASGFAISSSSTLM